MNLSVATKQKVLLNYCESCLLNTLAAVDCSGKIQMFVSYSLN